MWWPAVTLAILAALMIVNNRAACPWCRRADLALLAAWLVNLAAVFWAMGWRWGLAGIVISIVIDSIVVLLLADPAEKRPDDGAAI